MIYIECISGHSLGVPMEIAFQHSASAMALRIVLTGLMRHEVYAKPTGMS